MESSRVVWVKVWDVVTRRTKMVKNHSGIVTCNDCGRSWDDTIVTGVTPAPAARCPFEGMRRYRVLDESI